MCYSSTDLRPSLLDIQQHLSSKHTDGDRTYTAPKKTEIVTLAVYVCVCHSGVHTAARKPVQILTDSYNPALLNITCRRLNNLIKERRHTKKKALNTISGLWRLQCVHYNEDDCPFGGATVK